MRSWPIRWKLFATPVLAALLVGVALLSSYESSRYHDQEIRAAVNAAILPAGSAASRNGPALRAAQAAAAQAIDQSAQAFLDDRIILVACLCAAVCILLFAGWSDAKVVSKSLQALEETSSHPDTARLPALRPIPAGDDLEVVPHRQDWSKLTGNERDGRLRRSTEFLEFAQAAGGFGVFDLDLITGQVTGTPLFYGLAGLKSSTPLFSREEWLATVHPEDLEALIQNLNAAILAGSTFNVEYRSLVPTGGSRWLAGSGQVLVDENGAASHAVGTVQDVTQRKQLEASLRHATESLSIAQAVGGVATMDLDIGRKVWLTSDNFHEILGISRSTPVEDFEGRLAGVHRDDKARIRGAALATTREAPTYRCDYRVVLPDGTERWISEAADCKHDRTGKLTRIIGSLVDITHLKQIPLIAQEKRTARLLRGARDDDWDLGNIPLASADGAGS